MQQQDLVGVSDIARLAGVSRQVVSNWRARYADFPDPRAVVSGGPAFGKADIEAWLRDRGKVQGEGSVADSLSGGTDLLGGFWSYVRADNEAEGGRILDLARDMVAEYEMLTGEKIQLFLDRDSLRWGDDFRKKMDSSLDSALFLIPVLTPRYFQSAECRRELQYYARGTTERGVRDLLLPLLYVEVPGIRDDEPADDLMALVKTFQWEDWTTLRFAERSSREYRAAVSALAARLVAANRVAERVNTPDANVSDQDLDGDDELGIWDRIEEAQAAMEPYAQSLGEFGNEIARVGELMVEATAEFETSDRRGLGAAGRVSVMRRLAAKLDVPIGRMLELGGGLTTQLHSIDSGTRALIEALPASVEADPASRQQACDFFNTLLDFARRAREMAAPLKSMVDQSAPMEKMSRDLRPRLRRLRQALTVIIEGQEVIQEWVALIDASPINCSQSS